MSTTKITNDNDQASQPYDIQDVPIIASVFDDVVASVAIAGTTGARSRLTCASRRAEAGTDALT